MTDKLLRIAAAGFFGTLTGFARAYDRFLEARRRLDRAAR